MQIDTGLHLIVQIAYSLIIIRKNREIHRENTESTMHCDDFIVLGICYVIL